MMHTHVKKTSCTVATLLALSLACCATTALAARPGHPLADIQATAVDFVLEHAERFPVPPKVTPGQLDSRLRLSPCEVPLTGYESPGGLKAGHSVVGVACDGARPWKLYVPVDVQLPAQVIALARPMRRGDMLSEADLTVIEADLARLRGQYFLDTEGLVGLRLKRHVNANRVLTASMIATNRLVERGSRVTILSSAGSIEVQVAGKALRHGGRGDQIRVKNLASGRTITAVVVDRGVVRAGP